MWDQWRHDAAVTDLAVKVQLGHYSIWASVIQSAMLLHISVVLSTSDVCIQMPQILVQICQYTIGKSKKQRQWFGTAVNNEFAFS